MLELALLDLRLPIRTRHVGFQWSPGQAEISTTAVELVSPNVATGSLRNPGLDPDLRALIGLCLATDPRHRPVLQELELYVQQQIAQRDFGYYNPQRTGDLTESDDNIRQIMQQLLLDANTTS